jgi:tetratricopeptide (TPR) repeat protein
MGEMAKRCVQLVVVLAAFLVAAAQAGADTTAQKRVAEEAYQQGKSLYDVGDYGKALDAFKRAYLAYAEPSLLFNMAQCNRQLGNKQEAINLYKSFLRNMPDATNAAEVKRLIGELELGLANDKHPAETHPQAHEPSTIAGSTPQVSTSRPQAPAGPTTTAKRRRAIVWGVIGGVSAVGLAVGLGVGLTYGRPTEPALMKVQFP